MNQRTLLILAVSLAYACGFQFMKNLKIPTRDRNLEAVQKQFGDKKLVVVTVASSELGRKTTKALLETGEYHVVGGTPDLDSMATIAKEEGFDMDENFTPMLCDFDCFDSVCDFCTNVEEFRSSKPLDRLICNPGDVSVGSSVEWSKDKHEQILQTHYLSPFLVIGKLLESMGDSADARVTLVGSPSRYSKVADLVNLDGFKAGMTKPVAMVDGSDTFVAYKALEDAKLCQKMFNSFLNTKYHKLTQITFNTYERSKSDSDQGLFEVMHNPACSGKSGISWSHDGSALVEFEDENLISKVNDIDAAYQLYEYSQRVTGAEWPSIRQVTSPCPTLKVIGAITKAKIKREEMKRMRELGRPGISEPTLARRTTKRQKVAAFADKVVARVLKHTVGRAARAASTIVLGQIPEEALKGSFEDISEQDVQELEEEISSQIGASSKKKTFGDKKLVVVTGTSSGLGRKAALALLRSGEYHVIGAVRDLDKMEVVAEIDEFDLENFTPMQVELNSFESVRQFCNNVHTLRGSKPLDRLICNAGVYQPSLRYAKWSKDGHEQTMQINYLSHFLMISLLMESMLNSPDPRVTMVGSVTGNDNTVGGGGVYPIADLHDLDGFKAGFGSPIEMADGYGFIGAKAYKDSKLCLMILANYLHTKYHKITGITFSTLYPGCIAESPLFREKRPWFRKFFPVFMKFITGGFVGEHEAGQRLFQVAHDPRCSKSGVYWSWNGGPREGRGAEALEKGGQISGSGGAGGGWDSIFENDQSGKVLNIDTGYKLFKYSTEITGAKWHVGDIKKAPTNTGEEEQKLEVIPKKIN